jgi:RecA-family ATPase
MLLAKFTRFAKEYECHVLLVVHPRKLQKKDDGRYVMPTGYDLYSSSHFYNLTDNGISLRADDGYTDVRIWKVRHQEFVGKEGSITVRFDSGSGGNYYDSEKVGFNPTQTYAERYGKEDDTPF